jgi:hypothetical protein
MGKTTQDISTGLYHVQIRYTSESVKIANPYTPLSAGAIHSRLKRRPQWASPLAPSMYCGLLSFPVFSGFLRFSLFSVVLLTLNFVQIYLVLIKKMFKL